MATLFDPSDRASILKRIEGLQPASTRQWGTMNPAQALAHCSLVLETAVGDRPMKQKLIGRLLSWLARGGALGAKPFGRNLPTDPTFVVADPHDLAVERRRLVDLLDRFAKRGPEEIGRQEHAFFGKLTGEEWGVLQYKHVDHHLRQFGA